MEGVRGQCWICECPRGGGEAADSKAVSLEKQLEGLFLLRKVLQVPHTLLSRSLEAGDAKVNICGGCRPLVEECQVKYEQLCQVTRAWEEIRAKVVSKMKEVSVKKEEEPQGDDVMKEIKRFLDASPPVGKRDFSFLEGDHKAQELARKIVTPVVQKSLKKRSRGGRPRKANRVPHACPICRAVFPKKSNLQIHVRFHTGDRPFPCDHCGKAFQTNGILKQHRYIHTGEKPYECRLCPKRFRQPGNLSVHLRVHTGVKPYRCRDCGKTFADKSYFNRHRKVCN